MTDRKVVQKPAHTPALYDLGGSPLFYGKIVFQKGSDITCDSLPLGERSRSAWGGAPHGGGGLTELRNVSDHDGAARADGRAREPNHHYTPETRG